MLTMEFVGLLLCPGVVNDKVLLVLSHFVGLDSHATDLCRHLCDLGPQHAHEVGLVHDGPVAASGAGRLQAKSSARHRPGALRLMTTSHTHTHTPSSPSAQTLRSDRPLTMSSATALSEQTPE